MAGVLVEERSASRYSAALEPSLFSDSWKLGAQDPILAQSLDCWAELDSRHRLVVDPTGHLIACGQSTLSFLQDMAELTIESGRLHPTDHRLSAAFATFLDVPTGEVRSLLIPIGRSGGHWLCRSTRLSARDGEAMIGLSIQCAAVNHQAEWIDLREAFDLTEAEDQILLQMVGGATPQAIAEAHELSINTVRTHLRHIYDKLEVSNKQDLWRRLCGYRIR